MTSPDRPDSSPNGHPFPALSPESLESKCSGMSIKGGEFLLRQFLADSPDRVYFKDLQSRFIAVSNAKAARHGLKPEELVGNRTPIFSVRSMLSAR